MQDENKKMLSGALENRALRELGQLDVWEFFLLYLLQMETSTSRRLLVTFSHHLSQLYTFCFDLESR